MTLYFTTTKTLWARLETLNPYHDIYERYLDDASFLWLLRSLAVNQPHYRVADIAGLECRIESNLDGLVTSPEISWPLCEEALVQQEAGEAFAATVVAFRSLESNKIQAVIEKGCVNAETMKGVASALAWLPGHLVHSWLKKFLSSKDLNHKTIAIMACSLRREDPANYLSVIIEREDCQDHSLLYARCLRIIGELKRYDLMSHLNKAFTHSDPNVAFWSVWSAILLGDANAMQYIHSYIMQPGSFQLKAIHLALRVLSVEQGRQCISELSKTQQQDRQIIIATAVLGDPQAIPWLISQMSAPALARLAGETFSQITGIDLERNQLTNEVPDVESLFNEADDNITLMTDVDENLPWPNTEKIAAVWQQYGQRFIPGQRYFLGQAITKNALQEALLAGTQRQRHAAALELALIDKNAPLLNTQARVVG